MSIHDHPSRLSHIQSIRVRNFKSISDSREVPFRGLTVLAGANSSGKSSLMQPILLLKQTVAAGMGSSRLKLDGPHIRFDEPTEFLSRPLGEPAARSTDLDISFANGKGYGSRHELQAKKRLALKESRFRYPGYTLDVRPDLAPSELADLMNRIGRRGPTPQNFVPVVAEFSGMLVLAYRMESFSQLHPSPAPFQGIAWIDIESTAIVRDFTTRLFHLSGLRNNPARTYPASQKADPSSGPFENRMAGIISEWVETQDPRLTLLQNHLVLLGLTWTVSAKARSYSEIALHVGRTPRGLHGGAKDLVNIADVGLGVSQALPVVVALIAAEPGDILYVEQPEIHLHPKAQVELAGLIAEAVMRDVQVIVETHSALMLIEFQRIVANRGLNPEDVSLLWFKRDDQGMTKTISAQPDKTGAYGEWPEDFASTQMELERNYSKAAITQLRLDIEPQ